MYCLPIPPLLAKLSFSLLFHPAKKEKSHLSVSKAHKKSSLNGLAKCIPGLANSPTVRVDLPPVAFFPSERIYSWKDFWTKSTPGNYKMEVKSYWLVNH